MQQVLPLITIVTPSYNQGRLLESTIRSVVDQGYPNLEYVVIDGGSTDGSVGILKEYSPTLGRWVSEPDAGHADGINKGFRGTNGELMAWINASDVYYPWTLSTVAEVFAHVPEAQWIVGMPSHLAETGGPKRVSNAKWSVYDFLSRDSTWLQQESVFWRRSLWDAAGGQVDASLEYACDFDLWTRFIQRAPLYHVDVPLAGFRVHDSQRGTCAKRQYQQEAERVREGLRRKLGRRECRRTRAAMAMKSSLGTTAGRALKRAGLLRWYVHPVIKYNFATGRWFAAAE